MNANPRELLDRLLACDAMVGNPGVPLPEHRADVEDLATEMRRLGVAKAIVRNGECLSAAPYFGNDMLSRDVADKPQLRPAWFLTPDGRGPHHDVAGVVDEMAAKNVAVAWTSPLVNARYGLQYRFQAWCCGDMLSALQERRIPLLIGFDSVDSSDLHHVMTDYPRLRVILLNIPRLGRQAVLESLLKLHSELHLCFSPSFEAHGAYKDLCSRYGDHRWVWGMGYPESSPGAAITALTYSGLTARQLEAVAFGNVERLLSEAKQAANDR